MAVKIQLRRDTSTTWSINNPVLSEGEIGIELDTLKMKIGNGVNTWNTLSYFAGNVNSSDAGTAGWAENSLLFDSKNSAFYLNRANHTGTESSYIISDFDTRVNSSTAGYALNSNNAYTANNAINLNNQTAAFYLNRSNHIGNQNVASISDLITNGTSGFALNASMLNGHSYNEIISHIPYVTPEEFGAIGDGVTDDATALQNAINSGLPVYLKSKNYRINSSLILSSNVKIFGSGFNSIISTVSNISILVFQGKNIQLSDFTLLGNDTGSAQTGINITGNVGLTLDYTQNRISNLNFRDLTIGLYVTLVIGSTNLLHNGSIYAINCLFESCTTGVFLDARAEYCIFSNCTIYSCATGYRNNGGNNSFTGGQIVDCTTGVLLGTGSNDGKGTVSGSKINHCATGVSSVGLTQGYLFADNYFAVSSINISTSTGIVFKNNIFSTSDITVTNCTLTEFFINKFRTNPTITVTGTDPIWSDNTFDAGVIPNAVKEKSPKVIGVAASDETTALTTGIAKVTFRMPYSLNLTSVRANLVTAQVSGSVFTVDINKGSGTAGVSILSTKLTIDNLEKTSTTAAIPTVISDSNLADDTEISVDIDQIGNGTAKGLKIWLIGT